MVAQMHDSLGYCYIWIYWLIKNIHNLKLRLDALHFPYFSATASISEMDYYKF